MILALLIHKNGIIDTKSAMTSKKDFEVKYSKSRIALFQLIDAVELYYKERYVSAVTLAGAAEEIFGKLSDERNRQILNKPSRKNHLDDYLNWTVDLGIFENNENSENEVISKSKKVRALRKDLLNQRNDIRNALKHKSPGEDKVKANFRTIAEKHIGGAIINYGYLNGNLPQDEVILKFCDEIGISFSTTINQNHEYRP